MAKDYIEIAGRRYRVESNWNALTAYLEAVGRNTLDELSRIDSIKPSELTALMAACIAEGERLDGRDGAPSALDLGTLISPEDVRRFFDIYVRQSSPQRSVGEEKKETREAEPAV